MRRLATSTLLGLGLLLFAGMPAAAASFGRGAAAIDVESLRIPHEKFVLDNGLTVLVHEDHSVPLVAVNVWYHVGSRDEQRGRTGFAHLFEHFFFNGSEHYPHGFREAMDDLGANNRNGTTNTDRTNFFEDVPVSALERTLYLEADRMGWLAGNLSEAMLERERGVVKNEKRQGEDQPYGRVFGRIVETIYPYSHPYSWSTIGSMADLDAAKMEDIRAWYESYYGPNNAVLVLAGDITTERARELVQKYFGAIPPGPPVARLQAWVPELGENIRETMQDRVPQARIYRVWHLPPLGERATHEMQLFADALAGSESSPLNRRLVFDKQLATGVGAFVWGKELASALIVQASVKPGVDPAEVEREIDAVIAQALEKGPSAEQLDRARTRMFARFARGIERLGGMGGRSDMLAESETYFGDAEAYLDRLRTYAAATPAAVRDSARVWLARSHYTLTVEPFPQLAASKDTIDRSQLPALGDAPDVTFPEVQRTTLSNGLKVMLLERHSAPLVNVSLAVDAGNAADPAGAAGLSQLALNLLEKGTASRDAFAIADRRDALGATIATGNSQDLSFVQMNALRMNLGGSVDLLADLVRNPTFPADMLDVQRKQTLAGIAQAKANPQAMAMRAIPPLLYGEGHAYAGVADEKSIAGLTREQLANWHATWFRPNNATLIVAGDVTMDQLKPELERAFGGWKSADVPQKQLTAAQSPGRGKVHLIDKPGAEQSVIVAAHLAPPGGQGDDLAIETVMRNFGGMATSRLNRNLRLEKHWSYGAFGGLRDARGPRGFTVIAPVQADRTREAMVEVLKEIRGVAGERPLAGEEFESIMRSQVARLPGRFETLSSLIAAATDLVATGRDASYYYDYAKNARSLTEADLAAAGSKYVQPEELTWIVIGDLRRIEAGIRELAYGEVVRMTADGEIVTAP